MKDGPGRKQTLGSFESLLEDLHLVRKHRGGIDGAPKEDLLGLLAFQRISPEAATAEQVRQARDLYKEAVTAVVSRILGPSPTTSQSGRTEGLRLGAEAVRQLVLDGRKSAGSQERVRAHIGNVNTVRKNEERVIHECASEVYGYIGREEYPLGEVQEYLRVVQYMFESMSGARKALKEIRGLDEPFPDEVPPETLRNALFFTLRVCYAADQYFELLASTLNLPMRNLLLSLTEELGRLHSLRIAMNDDIYARASVLVRTRLYAFSEDIFSLLTFDEGYTALRQWDGWLRSDKNYPLGLLDWLIDYYIQPHIETLLTVCFRVYKRATIAGVDEILGKIKQETHE